MNSQYIDFIGLYDNVFPDGFCNHMITEFDRLFDKGLCRNRQSFDRVRKIDKQDDFCFINVKNHAFSDFNGVSVIEAFTRGLQDCFDEYINEYDILKEFNLKSTVLKMQKTAPGGGYHVWHPEQGHGDMASRCLTFISYLNTIKDAGETEFLYQKLRVPPKENTMTIWPASFTHTHRGNVVHGDKAKYIVTGWFYLD